MAEARVEARVEALIMRLLVWLTSLAAAARSGRADNPKRVKLAALALAVILVCRKGTRAEKDAFVQSLFAKVNAKLDRIVAVYIKWRQRKCWMWGGGFRLALTARPFGIFKTLQDQSSFDALIPD